MQAKVVNMILTSVAELMVNGMAADQQHLSMMGLVHPHLQVLLGQGEEGLRRHKDRNVR